MQRISFRRKKSANSRDPWCIFISGVLNFYWFFVKVIFLLGGTHWWGSIFPDTIIVCHQRFQSFRRPEFVFLNYVVYWLMNSCNKRLNEFNGNNILRQRVSLLLKFSFQALPALHRFCLSLLSFVEICIVLPPKLAFPCKKFLFYVI